MSWAGLVSGPDMSWAPRPEMSCAGSVLRLVVSKSLRREMSRGRSWFTARSVFSLSHVTACTSKSVKTSNVARGKLHTSNLWMIKKQWMFFSGCPLLSSYYILHCMYTPSTKTRYQQDRNSFVLENFILILEDLDFFSVEIIEKSNQNKTWFYLNFSDCC